MSAHAVSSVSAVPASSKSPPTDAAQGSAAAFKHQLHAARQQGNATAQDRGETHDHRARTEKGRDADRDQRSEPSSPRSDATRSDATQVDSGKTRLDKNAVDTPGKKVLPSTAPAETAARMPALAAAEVGADLALGDAVLAEVGAKVASAEATVADKEAQVDEQGAATLVGTMLNLIGPAVGKVLTPAAASAAMSATSVTVDAAAAALLQADDVVTLATTGNAASAALPAQMFAVNTLSLELKDGHEPSVRGDAAALTVLSPSTLAAPAAPVSAPISAAVGSQAFAQELGQQVSWFVGQDVKQARIRLHPEELGSLDLKISVNHGRVDVVFHAQHPGAVTAVQQSLPQLEQMLAQHGLSLGNTEVGQQDRGDQQGRAGHDAGVAETADVHAAGVTASLSQIGLLDAFA